jgi:hypothetical protein
MRDVDFREGRLAEVQLPNTLHHQGPLCGLLSPSCSGVGLSLLGCGLPGGGYTPVGQSIQPVRRKARAGVALDVSGL